MKILLYILFLIPFFALSQSTINGKVTNETDYDGIQVFNKTQSKYTITNDLGEFKIIAKVNDTIVFSAIQYKLEELIVTEQLITDLSITIFLTIHINDLGAVYIGPKLSGNLLTDIKNIPTKELVTAKTLGLPNAGVKPLTLAERELYTATNGGGVLSVDAIINILSGRTKKLKLLLKLERKAQLEDRVHYEFKRMIIADFQIPKNQVQQFIFYAAEDKLFSQIAKTKNGIVMYQFLKNKGIGYLSGKSKIILD